VSWGEPREPDHDHDAAWPGVIPGPAPARVFDRPHPADLLDGAGRPVAVSARGEVDAEPATLRCRALPAGGGPIEAAAGPWPHALRWWDRSARRRCAHWQVVVGGVACLVALEAGAAVVTAVYD
jgi:protein ImuB